MSNGRDLDYMNRVADALQPTRELRIMPEWEWKAATRPHPYPRIDVPEADTQVIIAQMNTRSERYCWVDAGTGHKFSPPVPALRHTLSSPVILTPIVIEDPRGNRNLGADMDWLARVVEQFWTHIGGETNTQYRSPTAVPFFVEEMRQQVAILEKVMLYAAYEGKRSEDYTVFNPKEVQ